MSEDALSQIVEPKCPYCEVSPFNLNSQVIPMPVPFGAPPMSLRSFWCKDCGAVISCQADKVDMVQFNPTKRIIS